MLNRKIGSIVAFVSCSLFLSSQPLQADVSGFIASVGFDEDANLDRGMGFGLRWGRSSSILGGETSVMIAMPDRELEGSKQSATAIFYEGRVLVNIPVGQVSPFVGVGFGQIIVTSTDVPITVEPGRLDLVKEASKLQTSNAFSYGAGARYALSNQVDARVDVRQYIVFSVTGLPTSTQIDQALQDNTVKYNEISLGLSLKF